MSDIEIKRGLKDVYFATSEASFIDGNIGKLLYRGYNIDDMARNSTFEETVYLLLFGKLPTAKELLDFDAQLRANRTLPREVLQVIEIVQASHPMDVLRTGCSALGCLEPESATRDQHQVADRLLAAFPSMLLYWYQFHAGGKRIETETDDPSMAAHFLHLLSGKPADEMRIRALDASFILYAEHEFNASTFAARITASTLADFYSAITSGIGTLRGPLHGGANEEAMALIERFQTPDEAEAGLMDMLARKQLVMGFGHRVYKNYDPRARIIKQVADQVFEVTGKDPMLNIALELERIALEDDYFVKRRLYPNVDFYSGIMYEAMGFKPEMFTVLFAIPRTAGWLAQWQEMLTDPEQKIARPRQVWIGHDTRPFVPIEQRGTGVVTR